MYRLPRRPVAVLAGLLVAAPLALVGPAAQATDASPAGKSCSVSVSDSKPKQYSTVTVRVSAAGKKATVTTKAK